MREFEAKVNNVPGLYAGRHSKLIYGLIRSLQPKISVEVGAWLGHTSCWMAKAIQDNGFGQLYLIDNFQLGGGSAATLHNNLVKCGVASCAVIVDGSSEPANWPQSCDFAYIDADHSHEGCAKDINTAIGLGANCIVVHDTVSWWGPRRVVEEFRSFEDRHWDILEFLYDEGLAVFLKRFPKPDETYTEEKYPDGLIH